MQDVPKIVRERLTVTTPEAKHPDADVLTAFAEQALSDRERAGVLEHLARCGECRDVVALALPATEEAPTAVAPSRARSLTWPVMRWGLALAGVAVVASLALVRYQRSHSALMAYKASQAAATQANNEVLPSAPEAAKERDKAQPSALTAGAGEKELALFALKKSPPAEVSSSNTAAGTGAGIGAASGGKVSGGLLAHGPRVASQNQSNQWQQNNNALAYSTAVPAAPAQTGKQEPKADVAANPQVPVASEAMPVQSQSAAISAEGQNVSLENQPLSKPASNDGYGESRVEKIKPVEKVLASAVPPGAVAYDALALPIARWAINSSGMLQRSLDQGRTWQDVNVKASPVVGAAAGMVVARRAVANEKAKDFAKPDMQREGPIVFRAVAAFGTEVWAGGSAAALYHSIDAGSHWTRVVPAAGEASLTGDIVSLDFPDSQHGRVATSTPEVWLTSDGGQTWQKQ